MSFDIWSSNSYSFTYYDSSNLCLRLMKVLSNETNALICSQYFLCQECIATQSVSHYKLDGQLDAMLF